VRGSVPNGTNPRPVDETTENGNLDSDNDNTRVGSGDDNNNAMEQDPPSDENDTEHGSGASGAGTISPPAGTLVSRGHSTSHALQSMNYIQGTAPLPPSTRTSVIDDPLWAYTSSTIVDLTHASSQPV
jgi:hypothetical protein